jgi:hypothetical protein
MGFFEAVIRALLYLCGLALLFFVQCGDCVDPQARNTLGASSIAAR